MEARLLLTEAHTFASKSFPTVLLAAISICWELLENELDLKLGYFTLFLFFFALIISTPLSLLFFFFNFTLASSLHVLFSRTTVSRSHPENRFFFFFASEWSEYRYHVEFSWRISYMSFTKTTKWKINKTTTIKKTSQPALLVFFFSWSLAGHPANKTIYWQCEVYLSVTTLSIAWGWNLNLNWLKF